MKSTYNSIKKTSWFAYFVITISSILFTIGIEMFIEVSHTLSSGLTALVLGPVLAFNFLAPYTTLIYLLANIPIILIFWKGITRKFIVRTSYFLVMQSLVGALFFFPTLSNYLQNAIVNYDDVLKQKWPIFIMSFLGSCIIGVSIALTWKYGGSSGGGDIIVYYYSTKKQISVGFIKSVIATSFSVIALLIALCTKQEIIDNVFSIIIGTVIYIGTTSWLVNLIYPKYSKVKVEIHSKNIELINSYLKETYIHSWQIIKLKSGYLNKDIEVIQTIMLLLEYKDFSKKIKEVDSKAWISSIDVKYINGHFNVRNVEKNNF